tara:strand:- start:1330 stop:1965 length:636 start_codon:yes stop_codon:yes gene_type:complete
MIGLYINLVKDNDGRDLIKVGQTENLNNRIDMAQKHFDNKVINLKFYSSCEFDWRSLEEDLHNHYRAHKVKFSHYIDSNEYYELDMLSDIMYWIEANKGYYNTSEPNLTNFAHTAFPVLFINNNRVVINGKDYKLSCSTKTIYTYHLYHYNKHFKQDLTYLPRTKITAEILGLKASTVESSENLLHHMGILDVDNGYRILKLDQLKCTLKG